LLAHAGAEPQQVAAQLLQCDPRGDPSTVERLSKAAGVAMAKGAPEHAVTYLRRALAEPPPDKARGGVLAALGRAEACGVHADAESAIAHLSEALESIPDPAAHARTARVLGQVLLVADRGADASRVLADAVDAVPDAEPCLLAQLTADLLVVGMANADTRRIGARQLARLSPQLQAEDSHAGRLTRGIGAGAALFAGASAPDTIALARSALADGRLLAEETADSLALYIPCLSLLWADDDEGAARVFSAAIDEAHSRGSLRGFAMAAGLRAGVELRRGALAEAETDARAVLQATRETGLHLGTPIAGTVLIEVLIARGELEQAERLAELAAARPTKSLWAPWLALVTARLRLQQRRFSDAVALSRRCGEGLSPWKLERWAPLPWRSTLGLGLAGVAGDPAGIALTPSRLDEARALILAELEDVRRFGAPRLVGIALQALAELPGGHAPEAREALEEAVAVLGASSARLEHARALVSLGALQRRAGEPSRARSALREGLALARQCGATSLAQRAHQELEASGARVRKIVHGGVEALTPSERRVADMAATGMTNRQIAQALFLTSRTVETHLAHAYQKLDIRGRGELAGRLVDPTT
jgi:DNA-binding CsgD family transcriptional regulator